eukprot:724286-Rhodomonas_salina.4
MGSYTMSGTELAYGCDRIAGGEQEEVCASCLRCSYAMSGTDIAYSASCLRHCYAMSGTDISYGATVSLRDVRY